MSDKENPPVGYKNPPKHSRFRKGGPQPQRRPKKDRSVDVYALMSAPVKVGEGDAARKMHPYELALRKAVVDAIKGKISSIAFLLKQFERYGVIRPTLIQNAWPMRLYKPYDYHPDLWDKNLRELGPPPWSGEHDGVSRLQELRDAVGR